MLLKAGLISGWNKKLNTKSYLPANKYSCSDLNLSSHTNLLCQNCWFAGCNVSMRQKNIGILKRLSARYVAKKWIDEVTKSTVFNEALLESKKLHVIKCSRINLNYNPSNISGKLMEFSNQIRSDCK